VLIDSLFKGGSSSSSPSQTSSQSTQPASTTSGDSSTAKPASNEPVSAEPVRGDEPDTQVDNSDDGIYAPSPVASSDEATTSEPVMTDNDEAGASVGDADASGTPVWTAPETADTDTAEPNRVVVGEGDDASDASPSGATSAGTASGPSSAGPAQAGTASTTPATGASAGTTASASNAPTTASTSVSKTASADHVANFLDQIARIQTRFGTTGSDEEQQVRERASEVVQSLMVSQMLDNIVSKQSQAIGTLFGSRDKSDTLETEKLYSAA
jgi:hypothetical protein